MAVTAAVSTKIPCNASAKSHLGNECVPAPPPLAVTLAAIYGISVNTD